MERYLYQGFKYEKKNRLKFLLLKHISDLYILLCL